MADPSTLTPTLQFGAFGICVLLMTCGMAGFAWLVKNHKEERRELVASLERQHQEAIERERKGAQVVESNTMAARAMVKAFEHLESWCRTARER